MPDWDELPVAKLLFFPNSDDINKNIFAQARILYLSGHGLVCRIWSFETAPGAFSRLKLALQAPEGELLLSFSYPVGAEALLCGKPMETPVHRFFEGEDLQGEYWGVEFFLSHKALAGCFGSVSAQIGRDFILKGNIFSENFSKARLFPEKYGDFIAVNY